jgi:hypothetical protein
MVKPPASSTKSIRAFIGDSLSTKNFQKTTEHTSVVKKNNESSTPTMTWRSMSTSNFQSLGSKPQSSVTTTGNSAAAGSSTGADAKSPNSDSKKG